MFTNLAAIRANVRRSVIALTAAAAATAAVALTAPAAHAVPSASTSYSTVITTDSTSWEIDIAGANVPYASLPFTGQTTQYTLDIRCSDGGWWSGIPLDVYQPSAGTSNYYFRVYSALGDAFGRRLSTEAGHTCTLTTHSPWGKTLNLSLHHDWFRTPPVYDELWLDASLTTVTGSGPGGGL